MKQTNSSFRQQLNTTSEKALHWYWRSLVKMYSQAALKMDIKWHSPLPSGPKIIAVNHPTTTDPFYLLTLFSEPVSILITAATFEIPGLGFLLRAMGHIPAMRNSHGATIKKIVQKVESGRTVAIFPEGSLSPLSGGFNKPHSGAARVALHTSAPVIPVGIGLQRDRIRVTETDIVGDKAIGHLYTKGHYAMTIGRPLYFEGDAQNRKLVSTSTDTIMDHIQKLAYESERRLQSTLLGKAISLPGLTNLSVLTKRLS